MTKYNMVSYAQKRKLHDFLERVCRQEDTFAVYQPGWSDIRAAEEATKELGFKVSPSNVRSLRLEVYGRLKAPAGVMPSGLDERLQKLEQDTIARFAELGREIEKLKAILPAGVLQKYFQQK